MTIRTSIPSGDIPRTEAAGTRELRWFKNDSEDRSRETPHPRLGPDDVSYRFNEYGYRSAEFGERGEINVLFVGCSWIFGTGIPYEATACNVFCRLLNAERRRTIGSWNLAYPGKSNDYIFRMVFCAVPVLKPDFVFVNFTFSPRREYMPIQGETLNLLSSPETLRFVEDRVRRELYGHLFALASRDEDSMNLFKNYKLIELLLAQHAVKWLFSANDEQDLKDIAHLLDISKYVHPGMQRIDTARDHGHPGVESNRSFAERIHHRFREVYGAST